VAILVGALARIRQIGAEVAVGPPSSGAYQVLKTADLATARAVGVRKAPQEGRFSNDAGL
jgi:hypothetical protein